MSQQANILVVDDEMMNRNLLAISLEDEGYAVEMAENGRMALEMIRAGAFDVILLDLLMPEMDGYQVLKALKLDEKLRHIPVIVISALDDMDSVVHCIENGATDYLPKPFDASLLRARLNASLASKKLRDLELEYLEQVKCVMDAASALKTGTFNPDTLKGVSQREDALGELARVFKQMASEIRAREDSLKHQVQEMQIVINSALQEKQIAEVADSEYFRRLQEYAARMKQKET